MKKVSCILVCILCTAVLLSGCKTSLEETFGYTSKATFYVSSGSDISDNELNICQSDLTASTTLNDTLIVICNTKATREKVKEITGITDGFTVNMEAIDDTAVMELSVSSWDKQTAYDVCVAYTQVIPEAMAAIVGGSSVRVVDYPKMTE